MHIDIPEAMPLSRWPSSTSSSGASAVYVPVHRRKASLPYTPYSSEASTPSSSAVPSEAGSGRTTPDQECECPSCAKSLTVLKLTIHSLDSRLVLLTGVHTGCDRPSAPNLHSRGPAHARKLAAGEVVPEGEDRNQGRRPRHRPLPPQSRVAQVEGKACARH
jgi:hypothetical protein